MSITNATLAADVSELVTYWRLRDQEYATWLAGTPTGGPFGDGRYPLTNYLYQTIYVKCPAALQASVNGVVDSAQSYAADAAAALAAALAAQEAAADAVDTANAASASASGSASVAQAAQSAASAAQASALGAVTTVTNLVNSLSLGEIPYKNQPATISAAWNYTVRPTVNGVNVVLANEIPSLTGAVDSSRQVSTSGSLTGGGDLSTNRTLSLVNDETSPGGWLAYATDAGGVKGWRAVVFPTRQVATQHSLQGGGTLETNRTLSLVGDTANPGANKVYGTDAAGTRTWRDFPPITLAGFSAGNNNFFGTNASGVQGFYARPLVMRGAAFVSTAALTTSVAPVSIHFPRAAAIKRVVILGDAAGSCTVDIQKTTLGGYGGPGGTSICNGDFPAVSSAARVDKTTFAGWDLSVAADDVLTISLSAVATFKRLAVHIFFEEQV